VTTRPRASLALVVSSTMLILSGVLAFEHCGKGRSSASAALASRDAGLDAATDEDTGPPMDAREADAWARAGANEPGDEDLIRLTDLVGCPGLRERGSDVALRGTAIRAMAYCDDFSELPWLAQIAGAQGGDEQATLALDAIVDQASRVRRATDPEDADELHAGCGALLTLARTPGAPRPRRVRAVRALRMLADRGCVKLSDIPHDLDAQ
jgi:hypothetical protein